MVRTAALGHTRALQTIRTVGGTVMCIKKKKQPTGIRFLKNCSVAMHRTNTCSLRKGLVDRSAKLADAVPKLAC